MITDFTKLSLDQIVAILCDSGYGASDIVGANYVSCVAGQLRYKIQFVDIETGEMETGNVYISIGSEGKLKAEF